VALQQAVQRPALSFERANLAAISLGGATVDVVFRVDNPNPIALSIDEINTRFLIDGKQVVAAAPPGGLTLPENGSVELRVPLTFRFIDVAETVIAFLTKQQANYRLEGDLGMRARRPPRSPPKAGSIFPSFVDRDQAPRPQLSASPATIICRSACTIPDALPLRSMFY
jgi:LEA14-like dessication related protein